VLLIELDGVDCLLVCLGDGTVVYYQVTVQSFPRTITVEQQERKKMILATTTITFSTFVFVTGDATTVKNSEVSRMCAFHSELLPHSLTLVSEQGLSIGTLDNMCCFGRILLFDIETTTTVTTTTASTTSASVAHVGEGSNRRVSLLVKDVKETGRWCQQQGSCLFRLWQRQ
jgi:hypothetical protein